MWFYSLVPAELVEEDISLTMVKGDNLTLNWTADGIPRPTIRWAKDGAIINPTRERLNIFPSAVHPGFRSDITGHFGLDWGTRSTLTITDLVENDSGSYSCWATNGVQQLLSLLNNPFHITVNRGNI